MFLRLLVSDRHFFRLLQRLSNRGRLFCSFELALLLFLGPQVLKKALDVVLPLLRLLLDDTLLLHTLAMLLEIMEEAGFDATATHLLGTGFPHFCFDSALLVALTSDLPQLADPPPQHLVLRSELLLLGDLFLLKAKCIIVILQLRHRRMKIAAVLPHV